MGALIVFGRQESITVMQRRGCRRGAMGPGGGPDQGLCALPGVAGSRRAAHRLRQSGTRSLRDREVLVLTR